MSSWCSNVDGRSKSPKRENVFPSFRWMLTWQLCNFLIAIFSNMRMLTILEILTRRRKSNRRFVNGIVLPGLGEEKAQLTRRNLGHFSRHRQMPSWRENHPSIGIYQHRTVTAFSLFSTTDSGRLLAVRLLKRLLKAMELSCFRGNYNHFARCHFRDTPICLERMDMANNLGNWDKRRMPFRINHFDPEILTRATPYTGWFISSGRGPPERTLPREFMTCCLLLIVVSIVG
jgi:hypothetical protein